MMGDTGDLLETSPSLAAPSRPSFRFSRNQSIALVFGCTIFGAAAQILMKTGANQVQGGIMGLVIALTTAPLDNLHLLAGYSLYGLSTVLLTLALRDGELSMLYPVISLTYVWVTILSAFVFKETVSIHKIMGISVIIAGVAVLGRASNDK